MPDNEKSWFAKLMNRFESLMHHLDIPEELTPDIRALFLEVAKEQYMAGNRSGIRWARQNPPQPAGT